MKKLIYLFVMAILVSGCATTSSITPQLQLGTTKDEVLKKCGQPIQVSATKDKDGKVMETFMYRETLYGNIIAPRAETTVLITYVNFEDGKVVYFGNPNPPTESSRGGYSQTVVGSSQAIYQDTSQESFRQQRQQGQQQLQQIQQQQMDYYKNLPKAPTQTNCQTHCDNFGNCNTICQ